MRRLRLFLSLVAVAIIAVFAVVALRYCAIRHETVTAMDPAKRASPIDTSHQANGTVKADELTQRATTAEARMRGAFLTPIAFYGRVVDQHGDPVSGAAVRLNVNDTPGGAPTHYDRNTDAHGAFSIDQAHGISVAVEISKPGYRAIPHQPDVIGSSGLFEYAVPSSRGLPLPDKEHPATFQLYKLGPPQDIAVVPERHVRVARNGQPVTLSLDSTTEHSVVLSCWSADLDRPAGERQYDWKFEVGVTGGGLTPRRDPMAFTAPEEGYVGSDTIDMRKSLPPSEWRGTARRSYFIQFSDGIYARADVEIHPAGGFVAWQSYLNRSSGNRNLEAQ